MGKICPPAMHIFGQPKLCRPVKPNNVKMLQCNGLKVVTELYSNIITNMFANILRLLQDFI